MHNPCAWMTRTKCSSLSVCSWFFSGWPRNTMHEDATSRILVWSKRSRRCFGCLWISFSWSAAHSDRRNMFSHMCWSTLSRCGAYLPVWRSGLDQCGPRSTDAAPSTDALCAQWFLQGFMVCSMGSGSLSMSQVRVVQHIAEIRVRPLFSA